MDKITAFAMGFAFRLGQIAYAVSHSMAVDKKKDNDKIWRSLVNNGKKTGVICLSKKSGKIEHSSVPGLQHKNIQNAKTVLQKKNKQNRLSAGAQNVSELKRANVPVVGRYKVTKIKKGDVYDPNDNSRDLSTPEYRSLVAYTNNTYRAINKNLRSGKGCGSNKKDIFNIDGVFKKAQGTKRALTVYRGAELDADELNTLINKRVYVDKGFASTSCSEKTATKFSVNAFFTINLPEKSKALELSGLSEYSEEKEILLNRSSRFIVSGHTFFKGKHYFDLILVQD